MGGFGKRMVVLAAALAIAPVAMAEVATEGGNKPAVSSPFWGGNNSNADTASAVASQLVAETVTAVPPAAAARVVARWEYFGAGQALNAKHREFQQKFEESPELVKAQAEFDAAWDNLELVRTKVLAELSQSPSYQAAMKLRDTTTDKIREEAQAKKPDRDKIMALADLKMDYAAPARFRETMELSKSDEYRSARARLFNASRDLTLLRKSFASQVRDSIDLAALRDAKQASRIKMLGAAAYHDASLEARAIALNYADRTQRVRRSNYFSSYNDYGYRWTPVRYTVPLAPFNPLD
jgi:hypothetical protein